jgi:hypothetical protein
MPLGAFLLGAWRERDGAHDQKLSIDVLSTCRFLRKRYSVYNTVVLESHRETPSPGEARVEVPKTDDADMRRQAVAKPAADHGVKTTALPDRQIPLHGGPVRRCLFDYDRFLGNDLRQCTLALRLRNAKHQAAAPLAEAAAI